MPRRDPQQQAFESPIAKAAQLRKEEKWSKVQAVLISGGNGAVWKPRRYDTFAKEAYLTQVVSYRCIDEICRALEALKYRLVKEDKKGNIDRISDHPVVDLMYRPNPEQSWGELVYRHNAFAIIAGNAYMERIAPTTGVSAGGEYGRKGKRYKELWSHRPDRMSLDVNPDTGVRRGFKYTGPSGRSREWPVDPITGVSDIWHQKFFNPLNDFYGAGPVEPTSREIDTSNEAMEWNKNLLQNQGRPGMVVSFKNNIGQTEYNRLVKNIRDTYGGPRNTGKAMILEGEGATVTPYGWSPAEMDYIEGNRELARRVALGFGVPPMLLGIPGDNTYSNYEAALLAFYENTVFFYGGRFCAGFSMWMFEPGERTRLEPDLDSCPALEPRRKAQFDKVEHADFLTINEKRKMCGYAKYQDVLDDADKEKDEVTGEDKPKDPADVIYQNATMAPLGEKDEQPDMFGGDFGGFGAEPEPQPGEEEDAGAEPVAAGNNGNGKPKKKPAPGKKPGAVEEE